MRAAFEELLLKGHIHILGICGTFMGGIALLARELGYRVTGSDANVYPPMSTQLRAAGIDLMEGYLPQHLQERQDVLSSKLKHLASTVPHPSAQTSS